MNILWFPRLQYDVDHLHLVTWREMARELEKRGHVVRVAVSGIPADAAPPGWIRLPLLPFKGFRLAWFWLAGYVAFAWHYFAYRPDWVLLDVHTAGFGFPWALLSSRATWILDQRTPIAHTSMRRGAFRRRFEQGLTAAAMGLVRRHFDGLTTITAAFRAAVSERSGVPLERIGVWGSGVDLDLFDAERGWPARPAGWAGRFVAFQHGELSTNRGILETVRALREPGMERVALALLGEGPAEGEIRRVARECRVEDRVWILPPVPHGEVPAHLAWCDCVVMAYPVGDYWDHNHPIKFAEALAMGKVVVCTPMAVVREAGEKARFLEVIPDNRPESIAAGIRNCLADPDLRGRGRGGTAFVRERGTWGAQAERLSGFILGLKKLRTGP